MRTARTALLLSFLLAGAARTGRAASAGAEPLQFLLLDSGARPAALGGAYAALASDANALHYNPAGLARVGRWEATFLHNRYVQGASQQYLGLASPRGWGASVNYLGYARVPRTTISNPDATLGEARSADLAAGAGYGRALNEDLSVGAGAKYIRQTLDNVVAAGFAVDLGARYRVPEVPGLAAGLAVRNMGPAVRFHGDRENLPLSASAGAAYAFRAGGQEAVVAVDAVKERTSETTVHAGAETVIAKTMAVRLGYNTANAAGVGITAGLGWTHDDFIVDYALAPFGELGLAHRLSVTMRWGALPRTPALKSIAGQDASRRSVEGQFAIAQEFIDSGRLEEAQLELRSAADLLNPDDLRSIRFYERMGHIRRLQNDPAGALLHYQNALRGVQAMQMSGALAADIHFGLGWCLSAEKKAAEAADHYRRALDAGPSAETRRLIEAGLAELGEKP